MLSQSDTDIGSVLEIFSDRGISAVFIVPTETGIKKAIMDATAPVRRYLEERRIHDYDNQPKGPENKRQVRAFFVGPGELEETTASLYRPVTKKGDPRIWFYGLKNYARPRNLLALVESEGSIYVLNCSDQAILGSLDNPGSPASRLASSRPGLSRYAEDLLEKLRVIGRSGYIQSIKHGDTGVGMTLEHALGIAPNAQKGGDYHGIEIKAHRHKLGSQKNRSTLFSQVPDWKRSKVNNGKQLLDKCGYVRDDILRLYCTVSAAAPNSQGLRLDIDMVNDDLWTLVETPIAKEKVNVWAMQSLRGRLLEKHRETFWVRATTRKGYSFEEFHYVQAKYTNSPSLQNFETLLDAGKITMDYTVKLKPTGRIRDHGYLFKMERANLGALFPKPVLFDLIGE